MKYLVLLILSINLIACNNQQAQETPESAVVAVVGEEAITQDLLNAFLISNGVSQRDEQTVKQALDKIIEEVAMANIAKKKKLKLSKEQLNTLKYLQLKTLANAAKKDYLATNKITDEEIQKEYTNVNKQSGGLEFHVHQLLYKDEVEAIKQLETIKNVLDFKKLEALYMQNNPNSKNIGDLGWVILGQLPQGFRQVLPIMKNNSIAPQVVNSKFGAHIVYLEDTRKLQPPKLEDVKEGIIKSLKAKQLSKFSQLAKAKAHVIIKE